MNKTLVSGLVVGIILLFLIQFPDDSVTILENLWSILGEIWGALLDLLRELI
jgi:hypothetical protein